MSFRNFTGLQVARVRMETEAEWPSGPGVRYLYVHTGCLLLEDERIGVVTCRNRGGPEVSSSERSV